MNTNAGVMGFNVGDIVYFGNIKGLVKEAGWEANFSVSHVGNMPGFVSLIDKHEYIKVVFPMSGEMKFYKNTIQNLKLYVELKAKD